MAHSYHFLDEVAVADLAFDAMGDTLEELFQGATCALIETLANPETVQATWERTIERQDREPDSLLFDWLSDLVYWKDAAGVVFREAPLTLTAKGGVWMLTARIVGAPVDQRLQELRNDVKGITKHLYELVQEGKKWRARVVLDV